MREDAHAMYELHVEERSKSSFQEWRTEVEAAEQSKRDLGVALRKADSIYRSMYLDGVCFPKVLGGSGEPRDAQHVSSVSLQTAVSHQR